MTAMKHQSLHSARQIIGFFLFLFLVMAAKCAAEPKGDAVGSKEKDGEKFASREFDSASLLPGMLNPPLVSFLLPDDFVLSHMGAEANVSNGVLWGRKETLAKVRKEGLYTEVDSAFFLAMLSSDVAVEDGTFSHEGEIKESCQASGMKEILTRKLKWGDHPVLTLTALRSDGTRMTKAWVGINSGTWVLAFDFFPASGAEHPKKNQLEIWNQFLEKTKPVSEAEAWKARGFDIQPGKTTVTLRQSGIEGAALTLACEERKRDKVIAFQLVPQDPAVSIHITDCFVGDSPTHKRLHGVTADIEVASKKVSLTLLGQDIPVVPKTVDEFSFAGKPLESNASIQFFGGPRVTVVAPGKEEK